MVELDILLAGLCGSDVGRFGAQAVASLGHEAVAFHQGHLFAICPIVPCGRCPGCKGGSGRQCSQAWRLGKVEGERGAFSGRVSVPASALYPMGPGVDGRAAVWADPVACGLHGVRLAQQLLRGRDLGEGRFVVLGSGALAVAVVVALAQCAAGEPVVVSRDIGRRRGLWEDVFGLSPERVEHLTAGEFEVVFDCRGSDDGSAFEDAGRLLRRGGVLVSLSVYGHSAIPVRLRSLMEKEVRVIGSNSYNVGRAGDEFQLAVEAIGRSHAQLRACSWLSGDLPVNRQDLLNMKHSTDEYGRKLVFGSGEEWEWSVTHAHRNPTGPEAGRGIELGMSSER